ncbi:glycoside hydrolase family 25 protein [Paenibacillus segetis]|uniref:Glycoside hydrolase family 25 n=1 Tax=Paenibacillus segetis TaxID=1325360 RepID=A0ABQ1YBP0_9BACL|nr:GH25 family lysozyme [Paenibacillus segetis]GGH18887.1 glycoside hydrolase family 25 [Paenibacillus segetis]
MNRKRLLLSILGFGCACAVILGILLYNGVIWFNQPSSQKYPVRGIDVSAYQGTIDWDVVSQQEIDFAFIKATEGSSSQDERFNYNWEKANQTPLKIGAYHFFSYDSSGATQADNFIQTVGNSAVALPPVIDIEFYGDKEKNPPSKKATIQILDELLNKLEHYYGRKPIIYATHKSYDLYLKGTYTDYPIWIRDVLKTPTLPDKTPWTFWQYSSREKLEGYEGQEKFIDMNVFHGTESEFEYFVNPTN